MYMFFNLLMDGSDKRYSSAEQAITHEWQNFARILQNIGYVITFVALAALFIRLIIYKNNVDKRAMLMGGMSKILIGSLLLGLLLIIPRMMVDFFVDGGKSVESQLDESETELKLANDNLKEIEDKKSDTISNKIAGFLDTISKYILNSDIKVTHTETVSGATPNANGTPGGSDGVSSEVSKELSMKEDILGLHSMTDLILNQTKVFSDKEWNGLQAGYKRVRYVAIAVLIIMVFITAIKFIRGSGNEQLAMDARESISRWVIVVIMIVAGPLVCKGLFVLGQWLTDILCTANGMTLKDDIFSNLHTGNALMTACIKAYYAFITLKLNIVYMVRKWVLATLVLFTPLAAVMFGIQKNARGFTVWAGEIISNTVMSLSYVIVFTAFQMIVTFNNTLITVLVGLTLTMKLGDMLRNSVQGLCTQLSGINENAEADKGLNFAFRTGKHILTAAKNAPGKGKKMATSVSESGKKGVNGLKKAWGLVSNINGNDVNRNDAFKKEAGAIADQKYMDYKKNSKNDSESAKVTNLEDSVQAKFFDNLSQANFKGNTEGNAIYKRGVNGIQNKEAVATAKRNVINNMISQYQKQGYSQEDAVTKANETYAKAMFKKPGEESYEKGFNKALARGDFEKAKTYLASSRKTLESKADDYFNDSL